jgi:hypothetical protein
MAKCGDCLHFRMCSHYVTPEETFPEVGGCSAFKNKGDFVEVVRCKDCKHFIQEEHGCNHFGYYSHTPWVDEVDFCSYGERRSDV